MSSVVFYMSEIDKFASVRDYEIPIQDVPWICKPDLNIALVYSIWAQPLYVKLLYLSLFSQFSFTDISRVQVFVFVEDRLEKLVREQLRNFPVTFVPITGSFNKFTIVTHPRLAEFDYVTVCDCDTLFYCPSYKFPLYDILSKQRERAMFMLDPDSAPKVFLHRKVLSDFRDLEDEVYSFCWSKIIGQPVQEVLPLTNWYLSCFAWFDRTLFDDDWNKHAQEAWQKTHTWCDETVFLTYLWKNQIPIKDFEILSYVSVRRVKEALDFVESQDELGLGILHPLHGDFCNQVDDNQRIYDAILEKQLSNESGLRVCGQLARSQNMMDIDPSRAEIYQIGDILTKICKTIESQDFFENFDELKKITASDNFIEILEKISENSYSMRKCNHSGMWHQLTSVYTQSIMFHRAMVLQLFLLERGWFHSSLHQVGNILIRDNDIVICDLDSICLIKQSWLMDELNKEVKRFIEITGGVAPRIQSIVDFEEFVNSRTVVSHYQSYVYGGKIISGKHDTMALKNPFLVHLNFTGKSVLDLGCAEGHASLYAVQHGAQKVSAVDFFEQSLDVLREFDVEQIQVIEGDLDHLLSDKFDICLCLSCLHLLPNPIMSLYKICKCCKTLLIELSLVPDQIIEKHDCVELTATCKFYDSERINWSIGLNAFLHLVAQVFLKVEHLGKNSNGRDVYLCHSPIL